jgi:hypothetical protein
MFHFVPGVPCVKMERFAGLGNLFAVAAKKLQEHIKQSRDEGVCYMF